jgi:hypothetical protein
VNIMTDDENSAAPTFREVARRLAELAEVPPEAFRRFRELLALAIKEASWGNEIMTGEIVRAPDVKASLACVATAAKALNEALGAFWGEGDGYGKCPGAASAGGLLEQVLDDATGEAPLGFLVRVNVYRDGLALLIAAADEAGKRADDGRFPPARERHRPPKLVFGHFVYRLYEIARKTGGRWTHSPNNYGVRRWNGTLVPALELLRDYLSKLPKRARFFPKVKKLGYVLDRDAPEALKRLAEEYGSSDAGETHRLH